MPDVLSLGRRPYRDALAACFGSALVAGLVVALVDIGLTSRAGRGLGFVPVLLGLYAVPSLVAGTLAGLVAGAARATWGDGVAGAAWRRLRDDRDRDADVAGALLAGGAMALVLALLVAAGAMGLVAEVQRKSTGALLLGLVAAGAVPVLALLGLPVWRVGRRIAARLPGLGLPRTALLLAAAIGGGLALALFFVFTRLEWRALNLTAYALLGSFPLVMLVWAWLWYGRLSPVRERVPARGAVTAAAVAVALLIALVTLRGTPSPETAATLTEHTTGAGRLVAIGRALRDADGDGYSAFLGGPDCDDHDEHVNPGAKELPGNGIDDNCLGGDRAAHDDASGPSGKPDGTATAAGAAPAGTGAPAAAGAAAGTPTRPAADRFDGNLLFIMVDTVRADRLGAAGYQRDGRSLTPRLDAFSTQSVWFTRAYAQAPNTPRSVPSFFASRYPSQIAVDKTFKNFPTLSDDNVMLWEQLQQAGLHTIGISSHFYFEPVRNAQQGFDEYDNAGALDIAGSNKDIASPRIVPRVEAKLAALASSGQRFAMFVHLFEPHSTYMEHEGFPITEQGTAALAQKYDYEVAYVDGWVGKILDALAAAKLDDKTMVVIMSDHGEAFGIHTFAGQKMFFHGQTLYEELLRVPVMIRLPGVAPRKVDGVTELVDLAPTILDTFGLAAPASFVGRSLRDAMRTGDLAPRPAHAELLPAPSWDHSAKAMISGDGSRKVIYVLSENRFEYFDIGKDPEERNELGRKRPEAAADLEASLAEWMEVGLQE